MHQTQQSQLTRCVLLEDVLDGDKVLQALRHLRSGNLQRSAVEEVVHPMGRVGMRFALSNLVVVMRELQILSSGVNVEMGPTH